MKDIKNWSSLLAAIGYMVFKAIIAMQKREYKLPYPINEPIIVHEEKEITLSNVSGSRLHLDNGLKHNKELVRTRLIPIASRFKKNPHYPGLKKLLLPAQQKDPYKLYPINSPAPNNKLNRLFGKYSASKKLLIMAEVLQYKSNL